MMAMGSLSVEISVNYPQNYPYLSLQPHAMSIPFGDNTNTQSCLTPTHPHEQYLEMVLGSLHPECQMDQLHNPYSVGAMFRCRKCESRLSSYGGLRTHLKTCSGCTNVVAHDGALKINELPKSANHNFHSLESQKVVPTINDLSKLQPTFEIDSKSCPRADSNSGAKNETLNSDIKQGFDPLNKADVVVFDTNNNEEIEEPAVEKLGASMMRVKTDNIPVYIKKPQRPEDMFHLVNKPALLTKKRVKPPPKQSSKNKKSKICAQPSLAVKLTSQSKNTFLLDNDPKTGSTSENVDDSSSNVRPKRLSKSAVSYEEKIADIFLETSSPHSSPKQQRESRRVSLRSESSAVNEPQEQVKSAVITNSEGSTRSSIPVNGANTTDKKSAIIHVNPKAEVDSNKIESNIGSSQPRDNLVLCKHCEQRHAKRYMIVHMRNEHPDLPFCCPVCYSAFASVEAFKVHKTRCRNGFKRIQDRSRSVSVRRPESEGTNGASCGVKCKECNEEFFNSNSGRMGLIRHIKEQHRAKFVCRFCFFFTDNGHIGQLHNCKGPPSRVQVLQQPQTEEDQDALTTLKPRASQETVEIGQLLENHVDAVSSSGHSHDHSVGAREEGVEDVSRTPLQEIGIKNNPKMSTRGTNQETNGIYFDISQLIEQLNEKDFSNFTLNLRTMEIKCPFCLKQMSTSRWYNMRSHLITHSDKKTIFIKTKSEVASSNEKEAAISIKSERQNSADGVSENDQALNSMVLSFEKANSVCSESSFTDSPTNVMTRRSSRRNSGRPDFLQNTAELISTSFEPNSTSVTTDQNEVRDTAQVVHGLISPSRGMKISPKGEIVFESVAVTPTKSSVPDFPVSEQKNDDVKPRKNFSPLHVDTKFRPHFRKESAKSGPPLNNELRSLLEGKMTALNLNLPWMSRSDEHSVGSSDKHGSNAHPSPRKSTLRNKEKRHSSIMSAKEDPYMRGIAKNQLGEVFACSVEDCAFKSTSAKLMTHLLNVHDEQWACQICFECFGSNGQLEKHLQVVHNEATKRLKMKTSLKKRGGSHRK